MTQATFAADIGKGVALGLKALGGPMAAAQAQGTTKEGEEKTRYSDDDIAAIMGFSHVHRGDQLQPIWTTLNNAKKNLDIFRRQLLARMMDWSYQRRIPIDTGVFLDVDLVKAIVELKFNPGEGVAHLNSAAKGLSILACRGRTSGEIKRQKEREEALSATEKTRQLDEFLRLQKEDTFLELKNNIAMFMGLIWVLFGSDCDYYKGLRNVYATMDLRDVMAIKSHVTAEQCRRITWVIIDDGRSYFDNVKTTLDFSLGSGVVFPQSYLVDIIKNVRYGIPVERANFPNEWLSQKKTLPQDQGQSSARTQGTGTQGTRGSELQTQRLPGVGTSSHTVVHHTGDNPMGDSRDIKGKGHKEGAMAWGIIDPTPTSPATPGTRTGPTNTTPRLKR
jgi:hypothetical protein